MPDREFFYYKSLDAAHTRRISYILFTRNRGHKLTDTIKDVGRSLHADDELIVVDGASTDTTEEVVVRHRNIVHIFLSEQDRSAQHGVNKGIMLSSGKYIILLPDEDRVHSEGVEAAINVIEKNPAIDLLVCGGMKHFVASHTSRPFYYPHGKNYGSTAVHAFTYGTCGNGFFIRRSTFAKVGLFPLDATAWDVIWFAQCIYYGGVVKFARINLFDHYITEDSISNNNKLRLRMEAERMRFITMYCPPAFARVFRREKSIYYRMSGLNYFINFVELTAGLLRPDGVRMIKHRISRAFVNKEKNTKIINPVWDGGFS